MAFEKSSFSIALKDFSNERSGFGFDIGLITAANLAARITARDAFIDALEDITDGVIQDSQMGLNKKFNSNKSSQRESDREKKILVIVQDTVSFKRLRFEVPCRRGFVDDDFERQPGTDLIDLTSTFAAAFVTATEAFMVHAIETNPVTSNPIEVLEMQIVGRNL